MPQWAHKILSCIRFSQLTLQMLVSVVSTAKLAATLYMCVEETCTDLKEAGVFHHQLSPSCYESYMLAAHFLKINCCLNRGIVPTWQPEYGMAFYDWILQRSLRWHF